MVRTIRHGILALVLLMMAQAAAFAQGGAALLGSPTEPLRLAAEPVPLRAWVTGEYLYWWTRGQPAPAGPLVTTGNPNSPTAGFLFDPSTTVLYGDEKIKYSGASGGRITAGMWLDDESITGIELGAFWVNPQDTSFQAFSGSTGVPILVIPFTTVNGGPGALYAASSGKQPGIMNVQGAIGVTTSTKLLGAELNSVFNAWRMEGDNLEIVLGLRYLDLQEDLDIRFASAAIPFNATFTGNDTFNTRNHFLGANLGARWTGGTGRWSTSLGASLALGGTNQIVGIDGSTTLAGAVFKNPGTTPGFLYTQKTNIGQYRTTVFSAVPQVQAKLGYNLTRNLRVTAGYDFLCWTNVARPTRQIDNVVNTTQGDPAVFADGKLNLVGEARPTPTLNGNNFWAQGVSGGLEFIW